MQIARREVVRNGDHGPSASQLRSTGKCLGYYGNIGDGFVTLAPYGDAVTEETRAAIDARKAELAAAPGSQFTGPINDNQGNEVLADGVMHTFDELMSMAYLVEGVDGEIPAS